MSTQTQNAVAFVSDPVISVQLHKQLYDFTNVIRWKMQIPIIKPGEGFHCVQFIVISQPWTTLVNIQELNGVSMQP